MEMDPSEDQEVMKLVEIDPDLSDTAESEEKKLNAIFVSALDMILKSLCNISVFLSALLMDYIQEAHHSLTVDESVLPQDILRIFLLKHLSLAHPLETNGVSKLFPKILELLPRWNSHFEVNEVAKTICIRCKTDMAYSGERSSGIIINANSLRVFKSVFRDFTFETIVKIIRINVKMLCDKEGCGKRNYVQRMINKLPTVFPIALQWENNETEKEIFDTASVLATEIDISAIYRYKGDSPYTKYRLISMVWSHGDLYNCVAYENNRWVRHYCSEIEVIGDWHSVLSIFRKLHIRPEILFFENKEGFSWSKKEGLSPSNVQEVEKVQEIDHNFDPDRSVTQGDAEEYVGKVQEIEHTLDPDRSVTQDDAEESVGKVEKVQEMERSDVQEVEKVQEIDHMLDPDRSVTQDDAEESVGKVEKVQEMERSDVQEVEKVQEIDHMLDPDRSVTQDDAEESVGKVEKVQEMERSDFQEVEKVQEIDHTLDPDPSVTQDDAEESVGKLNATCVSALDMILESLWLLSIFTSSREDESVFYEFLLNDLSLNHPLEANGVFDLFVNILEDLPNWDLHFEVYELTKKICNRCKRDMDYPIERSFGIIINAGSLREVKFSFKDYTFENIIKVIKMNLKIPCDKEGCEKQSYVHRMIYKLPSVFTIALEWTKNETEGEILDTTSVLATEIDISVIYQYIGDSPFTKYRLVSMVCSHEDRYNCVAYEKNRWVRYFLSEKEVIGDWESVVNIFVTQNIRPQILFFESVMQRDQIVSGQRSNDQ